MTSYTALQMGLFLAVDHIIEYLEPEYINWLLMTEDHPNYLNRLSVELKEKVVESYLKLQLEFMVRVAKTKDDNAMSSVILTSIKPYRRIQSASADSGLDSLNNIHAEPGDRIYVSAAEPYDVQQFEVQYDLKNTTISTRYGERLYLLTMTFFDLEPLRRLLSLGGVSSISVVWGKP
jgi:hypothetical protein